MFLTQLGWEKYIQNLFYELPDFNMLKTEIGRNKSIATLSRKS